MLAFSIMTNKRTPSKGTKTAGRRRTPWNAREFLYAVTGYLMMRETPLICSAQHNAAAIAEISKAIADANGLPECRRRYPVVHIPDGLEEITNIPKPEGRAQVTNAVARDPAEEILDIIRRGNNSYKEQNDIFRRVTAELKKERKGYARHMRTTKAEVEVECMKAENTLQDFQEIIRENL